MKIFINYRTLFCKTVNEILKLNNIDLEKNVREKQCGLRLEMKREDIQYIHLVVRRGDQKINFNVKKTNISLDI